MPKTAKYRKNFLSKPHLACSNDDLRPAFGYIQFKDGFLFATDAHIAIKQDLKVHGFEDEEIEFLNNTYLHKNAFAEILRYNEVYVRENGFFCKKDNFSAFIEFIKLEDFPHTYPKIEAVILDPADKNRIAIDEIGMNIKLLTKLEQCLVNGYSGLGHKFQFFAKSKAILVIPMDKDYPGQTGLIMPVMLHDH